MTPAERTRRIEQYASGPERLRAALQRVPAEARQWRPSPEEFSVHEVVCHCADSETNAAVRIRYLLAEPEPVIVGYNPPNWAARFGYASHPLDAALAAVEAVRANTVPILRTLPEQAWQTAGRHTEHGRYTADDWLRIYSDHVEEHIAQIDATVSAWRANGGAS
jgi:hypothetical protein